MGHDDHVIFRHRLSFIIIFSVLFLIISSWIQQGFVTEGRKTLNEDDKMSLSAQIGSRPPRCEGRCSWCGHCEAIQVPTNPQMQKEKKIKSSRLSSTIAAYGRGDDSSTSNYKPMSWKCKCGNLIFNP